MIFLFLPCIFTVIIILPNTPTQHGYKTQYSTVTVIHTLNNTVAKGFSQMTKSFDTINIHTLIRKRLQTNIPGTIIQFIADYTKGRKAYTTYKNTYPCYVNLKLAFPKVASSHPHYFTFTQQIYHYPEHRFRSCPTQITSPSHLHTQARVQQRNTYNHTPIQFLPEQNITISH